MIDWQPKDTIPDLREKISFLRRALREAHRREETLSKILMFYLAPGEPPITHSKEEKENTNAQTL